MSATGVIAIVLCALVVVILVALLLTTNLAGKVTVTMPEPAAYADLVPAPDEIVWAEGDHTTLWLSTNRHAVDVEIDSIALGLGDIEERNQGQEESHILGVGPGCLDLVVASLTVEHDTGSAWRVSGTVDRGPNTTGDVEAHIRYYRPDTQAPEDGTEIDVTISAGSDDYSLNLVPSSGLRRVQFSTNEHYPAAFTRQVDFDPADTTSGGTVTGEEVFHMIENTGLGLIACGEEEDVLVTLHGDEGVELNRYLVDVGPAPTPTPVPAATPAAPPALALQTLRFCPDAAAPRDAILTGAEAVGTVTASGSGTIEYSLAAAGDSRDYAFFELDPTTGAVTVSDAGADDHTGIDGTRLYAFDVVATDDSGLTSSVTVVAQVDLSNVSTNGDGVCP